VRHRASRPVRVALGVGLGLLAVLIGLVAAEWAPLVALDAAASEGARSDLSPGWIAAARIVTHAGDGLVLLAASLALTVVLLIWKRYAEAVFVVLASASTELAWLGLRAVVGRDRPVDNHVGLDTPAFPSGHSVHVATAALVAILLLWTYVGRAVRSIAVAIGAVVALAVGACRVVLLAHWPSDVAGGYLLAVVLVLPLAIWLLRGADAAATTSASSITAKPNSQALSDTNQKIDGCPGAGKPGR
jgi:membrane-associated phospholipid phosphatase